MEFMLSVMFILLVFILSLALFESRITLNNSQFVLWEAKLVAQKAASNINNVYLMDDNSSFTDYLVWSGVGKSVSLGEKTIMVESDKGFVNYPILAEVDFLLNDFNGTVIFEKTGGKVIVRSG